MAVHAIIPSRFLSLVAHLVVTIMLFWSRVGWRFDFFEQLKVINSYIISLGIERFIVHSHHGNGRL